jgi:hypothetical protein
LYPKWRGTPLGGPGFFPAGGKFPLDAQEVTSLVGGADRSRPTTNDTRRKAIILASRKRDLLSLIGRDQQRHKDLSEKAISSCSEPRKPDTFAGFNI